MRSIRWSVLLSHSMALLLREPQLECDDSDPQDHPRTNLARYTHAIEPQMLTPTAPLKFAHILPRWEMAQPEARLNRTRSVQRCRVIVQPRTSVPLPDHALFRSKQSSYTGGRAEHVERLDRLGFQTFQGIKRICSYQLSETSRMDQWQLDVPIRLLVRIDFVRQPA